MTFVKRIIRVLLTMFAVLTAQADTDSFCQCTEPEPKRDENNVILCVDCGEKIKVCSCSQYQDAPPDKKPLVWCAQCGGWRHGSSFSGGGGGAATFCCCDMPSPGWRAGSIVCVVCGYRIKSCLHHSLHPPEKYPLKRCSKCGGWWNNNNLYCDCAAPVMFLHRGLILCEFCKGRIRICHCSGASPPKVGKENWKCETCGKWRSDTKYCDCTSPVMFLKDGVLFCSVCDGKIRICHCTGASPPKVGGKNRKCETCGSWRSDTKYCDCASPVMFLKDGVLFCSVCDGEIRICHCSGASPPKVGGKNRKCETCGSWRSDTKYCDCASPAMFLKDGVLFCSVCDGRIRICHCSGASPPKVGKKNRKCETCGKWRSDKKKDDSGTGNDPGNGDPGQGDDSGGGGGGGSFGDWLAALWYKIMRLFRNYVVTDWWYFFRYFFTSYHLQCADPAHKSPREYYIDYLDRMYKGTYPASGKYEQGLMREMYLWSFLGLRLATFVGNTVGSDGRYDYCPIAIRYPFFGDKEVGLIPRDYQEFRAKAAAPDYKPVTYKWEDALTYFPEPGDDFAREAEKFAVQFRRAVHAGDAEAVGKMMMPGSPIASCSLESLRRELPKNALRGRASAPWSDTRLVPFLVIDGSRAYAVRLLVERYFGKLYVSEIIR